MKEKLASIESQYSAKVLSLTNEITRIRTDQTRQLKEVSKLHEELRRVSDLEIKDIKSKYDKEIEELREKLSKESMNEASSLNTKHLMVVERLKEEFAAQMEAQKLEMTKNHEGILATEKKMFEDRTKSLQLELVQREENLKDQISTLSNDLRVSRDKLALSEQKVRDLLSQFEEGKAGSVELRTQLKYAEEEAEKLRVEVREVKTELDISKELYQQQSADMKVMACKSCILYWIIHIICAGFLDIIQQILENWKVFVCPMKERLRIFTHKSQLCKRISNCWKGKRMHWSPLSSVPMSNKPHESDI